MYLNQACDDFLSHCRFDKRLSEHTLRAYATGIKRHVASLRAMFRCLENEEVTAVAPFYRLGIDIKQPALLPRALTSDELQCLLRQSLVELGLPARNPYQPKYAGTRLGSCLIARPLLDQASPVAAKTPYRRLPRFL